MGALGQEIVEGDRIKGLVDWIESMPAKPGAVKLVHGEGQTRGVLAEVLEGRGYKVQ